MSNNINKSLSEIFDVELTTTDKSIDELKIAAKVDSLDSLEEQRSYVKANLVALIEKGSILLDNISQVANSTENSKDYGAATDMLKTLVETNMTLLECEVVHKQPQKVQPDNQDSVSTTTNNTVFIGSTNDLAKYVREAAISNAIDVVEIKK